MRRILLLAAALTIPVSGVALALSTGAASAGGPKGKSVCSTISGSTSSGMIQISGCVDANGANTGGGTPSFSFGTLAGGGTVTFLSGQTATFTAAQLTSVAPKHCPGYVKGAASEPVADKFTSTVTGSTAGFKIPGTVKGEVCIRNDAAGTFSNPKPLKIN